MFQCSRLNLLNKLLGVGITYLSVSLSPVATAESLEPISVSIPELQVTQLGDQNTYLPDIPSTTRLVLNLTERKVQVFRNGEVYASYPVAIGKKGWETPTGEFDVLQMIKNPSWEHPWTGEVVPPGEENPLGQHWVGFWTDGENYIGFHGTPDESVVGQAVSHGCVRMRNADIAELYELVSIGTDVIVEP
jgi:lipoprotein-anchoring transpeptidase ErfK/SrfK